MIDSTLENKAAGNWGNLSSANYFDQDGNLKAEFPTLWEVQVKLLETIKEKDSIITKQQKRPTGVTILGEQKMNKINTENE